MPGPLDGVRIIDLTAMLAGPFATMILGDQGADVIKVEPPGRGDHTRAGGNRSGAARERTASSLLPTPVRLAASNRPWSFLRTKFPAR